MQGIVWKMAVILFLFVDGILVVFRRLKILFQFSGKKLSLGETHRHQDNPRSEETPLVGHCFGKRCVVVCNLNLKLW